MKPDSVAKKVPGIITDCSEEEAESVSNRSMLAVIAAAKEGMLFYELLMNMVYHELHFKTEFSIKSFMN